MSFPKLSRLHIIIIGCVACAIIGVGMYFVPIKAANEKLAAEQSRLNQYAPTGTLQNVELKKQDYEKALQEAAEARVKLDKYMRAKMPNLNLGRRDTGMLALWHEQSEVLGPLLIRWIRQSHVTLASSIAIPAPPSNPNDPMLGSVPIVIPIGRVTVQGTFKNLMNHIRNWNSCNRLVMVDAPTLTGQSPYLVCEYNMTVYIFPKTEAGPNIAMAGTPGQQGAGGAPMAMPGPMPGPMPGGPPGMGGPMPPPPGG